MIGLVCTKVAGRNLCRTAHWWAVQDSCSLERSARDDSAFTVSDYRFPTENIRTHPTGEDSGHPGTERPQAASRVAERSIRVPDGVTVRRPTLSKSTTCYVQTCTFCTSPAGIIIWTRRDFFDSGFTGHNPSPPRSLPASRKI